MAIDINLLDVWGNFQDRIVKAIVGEAPPELPDDPILAYRWLEDVRQQAKRVTY